MQQLKLLGKWKNHRGSFYLFFSRQGVSPPPPLWRGLRENLCCRVTSQAGKASQRMLSPTNIPCPVHVGFDEKLKLSPLNFFIGFDFGINEKTRKHPSVFSYAFASASALIDQNLVRFWILRYYLCGISIFFARVSIFFCRLFLALCLNYSNVTSAFFSLPRVAFRVLSASLVELTLCRGSSAARTPSPKERECPPKPEISCPE